MKVRLISMILLVFIIYQIISIVNYPNKLIWLLSGIPSKQLKSFNSCIIESPTFALCLIIGFFLLTNFDNSSKLFNFIPSRHKDITLKLIGEINVSLRNYVRGAVIDAGLIFVLSSIGFWIVGLMMAMFGIVFGVWL